MGKARAPSTEVSEPAGLPPAALPRADTRFAELRKKALSLHDWAPTSAQEGPLGDALREIDVYHTELELQNEELREAQSLLGAAHDRYRSLFNEAPVPFVSVSRAGLVLDLNKAALALLGRPRDRIVSRMLAMCFAGESAKESLRALETALRHGGSGPVDLRLRDAQMDGPQGADGDFGTEAGAPTDARWVELRCLPVGQPPHRSVLCHLTDVSRQREIETRNALLEQRLREAEKLEAIGRVAANIAHDVNNILVSVISLADFAQAAVAEDGPVKRDLASLLEAAWRGARLMRGLLVLSRPAARSSHPVNVSALVSHVAALQRHKKANVRVLFDATAEPLWVQGDEDELLHALLNVASNGVDAMEAGTLTLAVTTGAQPETVEVTVADEGHGMSAEVLARAFEPLFTTKSATGGSGLGLTMVHKAVSAHGGTVDIESACGKGTRVTITLPALPTGRPAPLAWRAAERRGLAMTILLVDDDDGVRQATRRLLESEGAKVAPFADGVAAFAAVEAGLRFDVALLDVNMPGWSGPELAERILSLLGPRPIVFVTGGAAESIPPYLVGWPHLAVLQKPWTRREMEETLRRVVESR